MRKLLMTLVLIFLCTIPAQARRYGNAEFVGTLEVPNSTSLPATCTVGEVYLDTDATSGRQLYSCESADTWVLQGDGGGVGTLLADGSVPLTSNWDVGAYTIRGTQFVSDIAVGTAPLVVTSTTLVSNLNADLLDGEEASAFEDADADIAKTDVSESITGAWDFIDSVGLQRTDDSWGGRTLTLIVPGQQEPMCRTTTILGTLTSGDTILPLMYMRPVLEPWWTVLRGVRTCRAGLSF